jgi:NADH-quinone oxidoreductase subunit H
MQAFIDGLIGPAAGLERQLYYLLGMVGFGALVVFGFILPMAGVTSWAERRVWARMQSRKGPNRVGPQGILQWLADGLKNLLKEDVIPDAVDPRLFKLAPYVVVTGFVAAWVAIPFAGSLIIADLNIGILYISAVTSMVVVGILMAGWSSNNKWSMLGGIRSATQIVSYEIPAGLAIFPAVLVSGTLSMQGIIEAQSWQPWSWHMFHSPFTLFAFLLFFVAMLAEGNRTPFDLPEAESELVAGFATEYSGMRSLLFFLAECAQFGMFFAKAYFWVFVAMWIRATLPRVRVDQLMTLCWKYMVPLALFCMLGTAVTMILFPQGSEPLRWAMFAVVVLALLQFARRVLFHLRRARGMGWTPAG